VQVSRGGEKRGLGFQLLRGASGRRKVVLSGRMRGGKQGGRVGPRNPDGLGTVNWKKKVDGIRVGKEVVASWRSVESKCPFSRGGRGGGGPVAPVNGVPADALRWQNSEASDTSNARSGRNPGGRGKKNPLV